MTTPSKNGTAAVPVGGPRLLDRLWSAARTRGDPTSTADTLVGWGRAYILFHDRRHPRELGLAAATQFLEHVVKTEAEPLPALAQARSALTLLYAGVLGIDLGELPQPRPPRLLDQLRLVLRVRHYSRRTEDCYVNWARRFILFHRKRHPRTMAAAEVEQFLTHLAVDGHISASSQNQALNALVFLYGQVLDMELGRLDAVRARRGQRLPVVLTPQEVRLVLAQVEGAGGLFQLMARLLYGCGLRVSECCGLRVHDVELGRGQIRVRSGKGDKDRVVMLPRSVRPELERQLAARRRLHERDLARGVARVQWPLTQVVLARQPQGPLAVQQAPHGRERIAKAKVDSAHAPAQGLHAGGARALRRDLPAGILAAHRLGQLGYDAHLTTREIAISNRTAALKRRGSLFALVRNLYL